MKDILTAWTILVMILGVSALGVVIMESHGALAGVGSMIAIGFTIHVSWFYISSRREK